MTRVFWTSTRTPIDGSTRDSSSTASTEWKNVPARPAEALGDLDRHHAEVEEVGDQILRDLGVLIHFADQRAHAGVGEVTNALPEDPFVLGEQGEGLGEVGGVLAHGRSPFFIAGAPCTPAGSLHSVGPNAHSVPLAEPRNVIIAMRRPPPSVGRLTTYARTTYTRGPDHTARGRPSRPTAAESSGAESASCRTRQRSSRPPNRSPQQDAPRQPTFKSGINFVSVDVIVSDGKGNPVLDLKPEDFAVFEDGKPQKVETFSVVKIDPLDQTEGPTNGEIRTTLDEEREAARPEVRLFVILLDDYHVRRGNDMAVRRPLIEFIENQLAPADMVAVMYPLTPVNDIQFTRSRSTLDLRDPELRRAEVQLHPAQRVRRAVRAVPGGDRRADPEPGHDERAQSGGGADGQPSRRPQVDHLRQRGLHRGAAAAAAGPQRLVSRAWATRTGATRPRRPTTATTWQMMTDMFSDMREVFSTGEPAEHVDLRGRSAGPGAFEYGINEGIGLTQDANNLKSSIDTLHTLANNTDGRAIVNRNDLASGMKQIMRDSSGYYLLGYTSSRAPTDGKFHEIKVNVKRRGVDVRARKGYWALTKEDVARATAPPKPEAPPAVTRALNSLAEPRLGRPARFWIGTGRGENGLSRVTFAWAPSPAPENRKNEAAAVVGVIAVSPEGKPLFKGNVRDAVSAAGAGGPRRSTAVSEGGSVTFDVPPGPLQLRLSVQNDARACPGRNQSGCHGAGLHGDCRHAGHVRGSIRGRTVRELQAIRESPSASPVVDREFSRGERLLVRVEAYAPGGLAPEVSAKLMNRGGAPMSEIKMQAVGGLYEAELAAVESRRGRIPRRVHGEGAAPGPHRTRSPSGSDGEPAASRVIYLGMNGIVPPASR